MKSRSHRLPTISDTPDDWLDGSWTVDCVCGVTFDDGEEMVDCDECGVWVHTRCSRYVKSEKLFSCDTCKNKKLRKESEETEVAQLLVELPTKTLRMDNPYPMSYPPQNPFQVWTEVPAEEKVHVQGIPGGDPSLFKGVSSVFSQELWKCTGYVPKKFNYQYREFPCWDNKQDHDTKGKVEIENHDSNGADALFLLSKENGGIKTLVNGGGALNMGPPTTDLKKQEVENNEGRRQRNVVKKERSLLKPFVIQTGNQKRDDSKVLKEQNRKKNAKSMEKGDSKKRDQHFESVVVSTDAKQSESNEGKGVRVFKTDKQSCKHENSRTDVQANHKSDNSIENNNPVSSGQLLENVPVDDSRPNPSKEAKQMDENDGNQVSPSVEISSQTEDAMTSALIRHPMETSAVKDEAGNEVVDDANENGKSCSRSNGTRSNTNDLEKVGSPPKSELNSNSLPPIEVNTVECNQHGKTCNSQNIPTSDLKLDSTETTVQDTNIPEDPLPVSVEVKVEAVGVSPKAQNIDKSLPDSDSKADESPSRPNLAKGHTRGSESQPNSIASPSGGPNQRKSTFGKSSAGKSSNSTKPSVPDKKFLHSSESKSKKDDDTSSELQKNRVASEKPKKLVKDNLSKSLSTSALKSSNLSKSSSHAPVPKKKSGDLKDLAVLSSSKTSISAATPDSGESANSELSTRGEKTSQLNRQPTPKNHHPPHVHPTTSTNSPATLSDEELALLLHQELNSSPRVPRVPRMRHAGSLPQLASTSTSTLMKRTSTPGAKDNGLVSRKKNKDLASREVDGGKKVDKNPSLPSSRRHDAVKNKVVHPPASTTVSSGPSSSNEANNQNASDDETGATKSNSTHRTLPGLIADIMSKGKRMTYEELCNAVLPHWPNLRKHNGERYAYSSHSQAVLDCLRNRSEWSRLVDRGPKTNAGRKRRKPEADVENPESEDDADYSTDRNTKDVDSNEFPKGKRKARKQRRLSLQGRGMKEVRRRRKAEVVSDDMESSSDSSEEESAFSDEEMEGGTSGGPNEASASSDEMS